jgi:hypothetical protein
METPDTETSPVTDGDHPPAEASGGEGDGSAVAQFAPRLLAFYQDVVDDAVASAIGWTTVAWGLAFPDGSALTVPAQGLRSVTLWPSVAEAAQALEACVDTPAPTHRLTGGTPVPAPSHARTPELHPAPEGAAARTVCPGTLAPATRHEDQDRPLGHAAPAVKGQAVA